MDSLGFRYDGDGNRLARIVNGTLTTHTLDVGLRLPEVLVAQGGDGATRYLHLPGGVATDDGTSWSYGLSGHLGSERQRVDAAGQVESVNDYRPFGSPLAGDGGVPYGFTGEWWEDDAGLLYLRARYYAPRLGIFLSQDPVPGNHLYSYVGANPINLVDPSGRVGMPVPSWPRPLVSGKPFKLADGLMIYPGGRYGFGQMEFRKLNPRAFCTAGDPELVPVFVPPTWGNGYNYRTDTDIDFRPCPASGCIRIDAGWQTVASKGGMTTIYSNNALGKIVDVLDRALMGYARWANPNLSGVGPVPIVRREYSDGTSGYYFAWPEQVGNGQPDTPAPMFIPDAWIYTENYNRGTRFDGTIPMDRQWGPGEYMPDGMPGVAFNAFALATVVKEIQDLNPQQRIFKLNVQQHPLGMFRATIETMRASVDWFGRAVFRAWLGYVNEEAKEFPIESP